LGDLLLDEVGIGAGGNVGQAVAEVLQGARVVVFVDQDYGEELLGAWLGVQRVHGQGFGGACFGYVLFI
jgi:hypothetical protein